MRIGINSFSGVICGYVENVTDAYLFGRINNGNAISYPSEEAERKKHDSEKLKKINTICKKNISEALALLEAKLR